MLNKLTKTLKSLIVSTIVSVLALIIGIILVPVYAVFATVIITLSALAVLYFGYALIKYIIAHRPAKKKKKVKTTKDWRDWVRALTLVGVIVIIILLLCRGCGNEVEKDMDVLNVGTLNVGVANVETENVENQNVTNQNVTNQDVGMSNVTEQEVVNQTVTNQTIVEEPKEDTSDNDTTPSTPVHTCSVAKTNKTDATCVSDGKTEQLCSCGKVITSTPIPATGHSWDQGKVTSEATETSVGTKTYTCQKCNETKTEEIAKLQHECKICDEIEIEATCTTNGKIKYVCSCGEVLDTLTLPKLGHDYEVVSEKDATATTDGYIKYRCENCGDTYEETILATGGEGVWLTASQTYLEVGVTVTITTTGSTANLEISYDPEVVECRIVSDKKVTIKWLGTKNGLPAPTAVSIYDVTAMNEESVIDLCSK